MLEQRKDNHKPLAVAVTLTGLIEREGTCPFLFVEMPENPALTKLLDTINKKYGNNKMHFSSTQSALDSAPMRISFNRIPDVGLEEESGEKELWTKRLNQFRVMPKQNIRNTIQAGPR